MNDDYETKMLEASSECWKWYKGHYNSKDQDQKWWEECIQSYDKLNTRWASSSVSYYVARYSNLLMLEVCAISRGEREL